MITAPILGELVCAHQTPLEFINPLNFLILSLPYGFGAVLIRELIVRRNKGLLALVLAGVAYGIYEEGIVVHSFFNPQWLELGALSTYGFFGGVNWTWSALMVHFHTFISIGSSILLAEMVYHQRRRENWLDLKWTVIIAAGFAAWIPLGFMMTDYFPPAGWYAASWIAFLILGIGACFWPALAPSVKIRKIPSPLFFYILGFLNMTVYFVTVYQTPEWGHPPMLVTLLFLIALDLLTLWLIKLWSGNGYAWDDRQRLALIAGLLTFFLGFSFIKDSEDFRGHSLVAAAVIIGFVYMWRKIRQRTPALHK